MLLRGLPGNDAPWGCAMLQHEQVSAEQNPLHILVRLSRQVRGW